MWIPIKGYEEKYIVSDEGEIISLNYNNTGVPRKLKPKKNKQGYLEITLSKNTGADIFVHSDKGFIGKIFKSSNKIEMDSQEFEKSFDVTASDKIKAMQLLTSDVMADLIDFKNNSKKNFELSIRENKLYFRFHCGNVFERAAFKDYLDYKTLYEYYNYLNFSCIVSKKIFNLVKETEL